LTYIRPHLEFAIQSWSPHLQGDIDILERVQRRATKTISTIKHLEYEERLNILGLTTLKNRRIRGDLIQQFKISHRLEEVEFFVPQNMTSSLALGLNLRGHNQRLIPQRVRSCEVRQNFFTNRVVTHWNALPQGAVNAHSVNAFKDWI
jgi:hypothetical protein